MAALDASTGFGLTGEPWPRDLCTKPPSLCLHAGIPHRHCRCLLPISPDRHFCDLCLREMLNGRRVQTVQARTHRTSRVIYWAGISEFKEGA